MKRRLTSLAALAAAMALVALAAFVAITKAENASGVTPTILARGHYDSFNVRSDPRGSIADFRAHSTSPIDILVRQHDYNPHSTTGWHSHPGPVFITVTQGTLTYYERDDPTCTPHVVSANSPNNAFVDDGSGHVVRNESDQAAQDISVITAPVGGTFRTNLDAPSPYCGF
jgi:hypothetical protein